MTDDQQRARELLAQEYENEGGWVADAAVEVRAGHLDRHDKAAITAITAALRAAPEAGRLLALLEQWEQRAAKAHPADAMLINKHIRELGSVLRGENLHNQHGVAVVADSSEVVPSPALGAHEVHPEAVDVGLDLGETGERFLAAGALEHASGVRQDCDGSATAPDSVALRVAMTTLEQIANAPDDQGAKFNAAATVAFLKTQGAGGPEGFVVVPVELTLGMLEAGEQELAMGNDFADAWEAAIETMLVARPQGVK